MATKEDKILEVEITSRPVGVKLIYTDQIIVDKTLRMIWSEISIQVGDILTKINGTKATDVENEELIQLFKETELPFNAKFKTYNQQSTDQNDDNQQRGMRKKQWNHQQIKNKLKTKMRLYNSGITRFVELNIIDVLVWLIDFGKKWRMNLNLFNIKRYFGKIKLMEQN